MLEGVERDLNGRRVRRDEARRRGTPQLQGDLGSRGRRRAHEAVDRLGDCLDVLPRASRTEKFACAATGTVVFGIPGLPPRIPFTSTDGSAVVRR